MIIYKTEEFNKDIKKIDESIRQRIENGIEQLKNNPYMGKPLSFKFVREKKVLNYRFYYLIYEKEVIVFIVGLSDKKEQQKTIDKIKIMLPFYREELKKFVNL